MGIFIYPSTLIRTSFVLSGMLGLRFDGIPNGNGKTGSIVGMIPIQVACVNQTTPLQVINSFTKVSKQLMPKSVIPSSFASMASFSGVKKLKEGLLANSLRNGEVMKSKGSSGVSGSQRTSTDEPSSAPTSTRKKLQKGRTVSTCDESTCQRNETCVTWIRDEAGDGQGGTYECIVQESEGAISFSPIIPTSNQLCPRGMTHSVSSGSFGKKCEEGVGCPVVWRFTCVDEKTSPHDCQLKKCPMGSCVEEMNCRGDSRPCIPEATCLPPYFFPTS